LSYFFQVLPIVRVREPNIIREQNTQIKKSPYYFTRSDISKAPQRLCASARKKITPEFCEYIEFANRPFVVIRDHPRFQKRLFTV
ncbi:MAG: hypothetical protein Q4G69_12460, partial [Planctomycetia bacterium]|nr:hypothetical protein [Planctomycetia bacterium]